MPENNPLILRIVVNGSPSLSVGEVRKMLLQACGDHNFDGRAVFAITPGGFIQKRFPENYGANRGWNSRPGDFRELIPYAQKAIEKVLTAQVLNVIRRRVDFLTLGIDLNYDNGKHKMNRSLRGTHAELIAVVKTASGEITHWTGKSYPTSWQEHTLVHQTDLKSHMLCCGNERVLILGCHDLNMFSNRSYTNQKPDGQRRKRCDRMRELVKEFRPTVILHHPHSTDSPKIWSTPWSGALGFLPQDRGGQVHSYASGIAYYNDLEAPRQKLHDVLTGTRCCDNHVMDVVVNDP